MKTYKAIGYPDEENIYHGSHNKREVIEIKANSLEEAKRIAWKKLYYFHEISVYEKEE